MSLSQPVFWTTETMKLEETMYYFQTCSKGRESEFLMFWLSMTWRYQPNQVIQHEKQTSNTNIS